MLVEKTYVFPDGNIIDVCAKRFRSAEVLFRTETYEPPDGNIIDVCAKRFRCAEVLFQTRPTSTQTETSSMSVSNASVAV